MFTLPINGIDISINKHNCNYDIIADWIEGSLLFGRDLTISKSDIIDILIEESIYKEQDYAAEFIDQVWERIEFRHKSFKTNNIFVISQRRIKKLHNWKDYSAYSFCIAISLKHYYDNLDFTAITDFKNLQGQLFENISAESVKKLFPFWNVYYTGWSSVNVRKFPNLLNDISDKLRVSPHTNASNYFTSMQKDGKLDILLYRKFEDEFCNIPIYLMQCASGDNWNSKREEPNIDLWKNLIDFNSYPGRCLLIPFSIDKKNYIFHSPYIKGTLFDRMRILSAYSIDNNFIDNSLKKKLNKFSKIIIDKIPKYT